MRKSFLILSSALVLTSVLASCANHDPKLNIVTNESGYQQVIPPKCPNWTKTSGLGNYFNTPSTNYKCATYNNYGAMIEDPSDMIQGKQADSYNAQRTSNSVAAYRNSGTAE
ncbi:MAG: hypothetical protein COV36_05005 [Alphaproteobacteria bacterium CG11_big_fil_rev_8_21_14_0_20_44_7]|nr:MAG: hypothetical protein COV36_05005 [Alphaproteobacteria bacterium CG11_big_fil_rev_8_21_14_0_20_44_7]